MPSNQEFVDLKPDNSRDETIEETAAKLVAEGVISDDEGNIGANTEINTDPEAGSDGENADENASKSLDKFRGEDGKIDYAKLEKSYLELEKAKSAPKDDDGENTEETPEQKLKVVKEPTDDEKKSVKEIADKAKVDLNAMSQAWLENGELSETDYTALEEAGYSREMVDTYARGLTASNSDITASAIDIVGSNEDYDAMLDWAIDNLSEAEEKAFDTATNSGDKATVLQAVRALNARYQSASDDGTQEPQEQINGGGTAQSNAYNHMDDYMADISDPRYDISATFRAKVMDKLSRSNI